MSGQPEFPQGFLKHCPKVQDARHVARTDSDIDPELFAECAFNSAGAGLMCENCKLHLTRPFLNHKVDKEWLPKIEEYYRRMREYEKQQAEKRQRIRDAALEMGAGI